MKFLNYVCLLIWIIQLLLAIVSKDVSLFASMCAFIICILSYLEKIFKKDEEK